MRPPRPPGRPARRAEPEASAVERFRRADAYRVRREWLRYEGTGQRDLYRELRERFLARHAVEEGWVLDVGSGPGRFLPFIGRARACRVALDVSQEMLGQIPESWESAGNRGPAPARVQGNAARPPLRRDTWAEVVVLGNTLGFAGGQADRLLEEVEHLVAPGGMLLVEIAPAPGERSRYLSRLPPTVLARLLRSPLRAVLMRLDREGFREETARHATPRTFRRFGVDEVHERLRRHGWELQETMAVAPALGSDTERISAVRRDPKSWARLLDLEEEVGGRPERWAKAAAVLVAARRASAMNMIK